MRLVLLELLHLKITTKLDKALLVLQVLLLLILITVQLVLLVKQRQMIKRIKKNQVLLVMINKAKTHLKQVLLVKVLKRVKMVQALL